MTRRITEKIKVKPKKACKEEDEKTMTTKTEQLGRELTL
jgi:hypothetical protein